MALNELRAVKSPFKFLDAFTQSDADAFFGRDKEVVTLYEYVNKNRLVLVYGQSGTGKTSLVQCGLASRFDITDWYPISIRRQNNINESLLQTLSKYSKKAVEEDVVKTLEKLNARFLRPIYLIFDQLEELLILGDENKEEENQFINTIQQILSATELSCHIIFIIREEYIGGLYHFEKMIPNLFDRRLRIEPMNFGKVQEVIIKSCEKFNIELESPEVNARQIIDNISAGKSGIPLPYLQVYLDMLYREDFVKTYSDHLPNDNSEYPLLTFTNEEIEAFGKIEDVLDKFLKEQESTIQEQLQLDHQNVPDRLVHKVLDAFVTEEGTKRPVRFNRNEQNKLILLEETTLKSLPELSGSLLTDCLEALENSRLVRFTDDSIELAHDSLAALIDEQRTDEQRQINEFRRMIQNAYSTYLNFGNYLSVQQYLGIKALIPKLNLSEDQIKFIEDSQAHHEAEEKAEKERLEKELATQKALAKQQSENLKYQKKANQRQRIFTAFMVVIALIALGIGWFAMEQQQIAKEQEKEAVQAKKLAEANAQKAEASELAAIQEKEAAQKSDARARENEQIAKEKETQALRALEDQRKAQLQAALAQGETLRGNKSYDAAINSYTEALRLARADESTAIEEELALVKLEQKEFEFSGLKDKGLRLVEANECLAAKLYLEKALEIKPEDQSLQTALEQCNTDTSN